MNDHQPRPPVAKPLGLILEPGNSNSPMAFQVGHRAGQSGTNDAVDQLMQQLADARREHAVAVARLEREFNAQIAMLYRQFARARAELEREHRVHRLAREMRRRADLITEHERACADPFRERPLDRKLLN
jgi:hypothetical protein